MTKISGRLRVWEDGKALLTSEQGEYLITDGKVLEHLFTTILATSVGALVFDHPCEVVGNVRDAEIHQISVLVMKTPHVDLHVKGSIYEQ